MNEPDLLTVRLERELVEAREERDELQRVLDLKYAADMRAIKRWQTRPGAEPGDELTWPDRADMVVWLLEQLDASPRHAAVPESGHIIRRCEKCHGVTEVPSQLSLVGIAACRACTAEERATSFKAQHAAMVTAYLDRTAEADRLRVRSEALEAMLVEVRKRILKLLSSDHAEAIERCAAIVEANGGQSVQHIAAEIRALSTAPT